MKTTYFWAKLEEHFEYRTVVYEGLVNFLQRRRSRYPGLDKQGSQVRKPRCLVLCMTLRRAMAETFTLIG